MWAREKSVTAEKRDRNAEREKETFRRQRHHQSTPSSDWWWRWRRNVSFSLSLHFYLSSPLLHFFLALTFGQYILFKNACELQRVVLHLEELPVFFFLHSHISWLRHVLVLLLRLNLFLRLTFSFGMCLFFICASRLCEFIRWLSVRYESDKHSQLADPFTHRCRGHRSHDQ